MKSRQKTTSICLHCTATKEGIDFKAKDIKSWHVNGNKWEDIGYHFVIDLDGTIEQGRREDAVGAHCKTVNATSIGIVYVGGLDKNGKSKDTRTPQQKESMYRLVMHLMDKYHLTINDVHTHREYDPKDCPCFYISEFRQEYRVWKAKQLNNKKYIICPKCGEIIYLNS